MRDRNWKARKRRVARTASRKQNTAKAKRASPLQSSRKLTSRHQDTRQRVFNALSFYRSGRARSASAAARMADTTLPTMRKSTPGAFAPNRPGARLRIKPSDRYSAKVQILTGNGAITTTARGSRQRELAGQHRATTMRVLRGLEPKSALERYRGKKVGGHELVSDYRQLVLLANAGVIGQLDPLYASPDVSV